VGVDPNICGFKVDESTFKQIKEYWINRKSTKMGSTWVEIQKLIPEKIEKDIHGSKEFLEWYRDLEMKPMTRGWFYNDLYTSLPFPLARLLDRLYFTKIGVNVHESPRIRDEPNN
jgi:hypothetical protein